MTTDHEVPDAMRGDTGDLAAFHTPLFLLAPGRIPRVFERPMSETPSIEEIKQNIEPLLGLQPLEHVPVILDGRDVDMFVDEMSAASGLARNEEATKIFRRNWLISDPERDPETLPAIYGPAVISLRKIWPEAA